MATQFEIDCALMSGYADNTRIEPNKFPIPATYTIYEAVNNPSGLNLVTFQSGSKIIISFACTAYNSLSDFITDLQLGTGSAALQLLQAAEYYLYIKANNPPNAEITFTGHSLGGGLAALMGVFFNEKAVTFNQAPFAAAATESIRMEILNHLQGLGDYRTKGSSLLLAHVGNSN
ncbi:MAG: hypothetical protein NTW65_05635 [Deltaproteobacteria bacterium]|nr:hypothetical protein [Deltaproteobacteria bacterium]